MPKLYSYVVDHDYGFAPNPYGGICTLAKCKFGTKKRNIVDLAEIGDWIAGTGGANLHKSSGHGTLIYAMRVDDKIPLADYCRLYNSTRVDAEHEVIEDGRFALMSKTFYYFGRNAIDISEIPQKNLSHRFEKRGPGHRCDFSEQFIKGFAAWLSAHFRIGTHGNPCKPLCNVPKQPCHSQLRRKTSCK